MLASRARILPRLSPLARQPTAARRFMANQPDLSPSSSPSSPAPAQPTPASVAPVAAPTTQPRPVVTTSQQGIATPQQRGPKIQGGYSGVFYLSLLGGLVVTAPIITYFYWEHRKTHMRQKKEAILSDIHARVGIPK